MKKKIFISLLLLATSAQATLEDFNSEISFDEFSCQHDGDDFMDFDLILSQEFDHENPEDLKAPQTNPLDYVPPVIRTIGFAIFTSYIELHNAIKKQLRNVRKYLACKLSLHFLKSEKVQTPYE